MNESSRPAPRDLREPRDLRAAARAEPSRSQSGFRVADYLDDAGRVRQAEFIDAPEVIAYTDVVEDEEMWGPRPRLLSAEPGGRRTVVITGRQADRHVAPRAASRGSDPTHAHHGFQADRTAMWAVLLCVIVLLAAVAGH